MVTPIGRKQAVTIYRIAESLDAVPVTEYEQALAGGPSVGSVTVRDYSGDDFEARLFLAVPDAIRPGWVAFLEDGVGPLPAGRSVANRAVLIVKVRYYRKDRFFALTFGFGRHMLRRDAYEPEYGLRVALNIMYEHDDLSLGSDPSRVRRVNAKTVSSNTILTGRQSNRPTTFDEFGVDPYADLLGSVTGLPADESWGRRITGGDSLSLNCITSFDQIGRLCRDILKYHNRHDYETRFKWIDSVCHETDPGVVTALEDETIQMLVAGEPSGLELAPPGLVDWEDIDHFAHSFSTAHRFADLRIADYVELLADAGKLAELSVDTIRHQHRVHAEDTNGNPAGSWSVFECLDGELRVGGETYLLVGGRFYKVAESYRKELDEFIDKMNEWSGVLPDSTTDEPEGAYNERAADSSVEYLNMDKALVRVGHHTNAIEFCDIYTSDGDFVHVKRHLRSNMLSHLFAQGSVAGDLFLMSAEYREKSLAVVREKEQDRATRTGDPSYVGRFSTFDTGEIVPARFEVVYAIVAEWRGRPYREALPFFSKVNLRRRVNELTRMGYRVSLKRVEAR